MRRLWGKKGVSCLPSLTLYTVCLRIILPYVFLLNIDNFTFNIAYSLPSPSLYSPILTHTFLHLFIASCSTPTHSHLSFILSSWCSYAHLFLLASTPTQANFHILFPSLAVIVHGILLGKPCLWRSRTGEEKGRGTRSLLPFSFVFSPLPLHVAVWGRVTRLHDWLSLRHLSFPFGGRHVVGLNLEIV